MSLKKSKWDIEVNPLTERKCRTCGNFLRKTRYFNCEECQPDNLSLDDDLIYVEEATRWSSEDELLLPEEDTGDFKEEDFYEPWDETNEA